MAKEIAMPPYIILHDSTLDAICRRAPSTLAELCEVPGIGERKAERFGEAILEVVVRTARRATRSMTVAPGTTQH